MIPRVTVLAKARVSLIRSVGRSVGGHEEYKFNSVRPAAAAPPMLLLLLVLQ